MEASEERKVGQVTGVCVRGRKRSWPGLGKHYGAEQKNAQPRAPDSLSIAGRLPIRERKPSRTKESEIQISAAVGSVNMNQCLHRLCKTDGMVTSTS